MDLRDLSFNQAELARLWSTTSFSYVESRHRRNSMTAPSDLACPGWPSPQLTQDPLVVPERKPCSERRGRRRL